MFENLFEKRNYLVIDDFGEMRSMMRSMLRSLGAHRIEVVRSAKEAIALMQRNSFDVVLCDYNLGTGQNGQQLLEEARHRRLISIASIFVMVTAESTRDMVMGAVEYEPDNYLSKPFTKDLLRARLEKLFRRKADLQPINDALERKDFPLGIKLLDELIAGKPRNLADLIKLKAEFCYSAGRLEDAESIYERLLSTREVPWARLGLGKVQFARKQYPLALENFSKLVRELKTMMAAYDWLSKTQRAMGQTQDAQQTLQAAVELSPNVVLRQRVLGDIALQNQNFSVAEGAFDAAVQRCAHSIYRDPTMYTGLAKARSATGRHAEALKVIDDLSAEFSAPSVAFHAAAARASVLQDKGDAEGAGVALEEAQQQYAMLGQFASAQVGLEMARVLAQAGHSDEAQEILRSTIQNNHDDEDVLLVATAVYRDAGFEDDPVSAVQSIRQEVIDMNNRGVRLLASGQFRDAIELFTKAAAGMANNLVITLNAARAMIMLAEKEGSSNADLGEIRKYIDRARRIAPDDSRLPAVLNRFQRISRANLRRPNAIR